MAAKTSLFQSFWICSRWEPPSKKESIFKKLDRNPDLLKYMFQFLPGKDIEAYLKSHKVNLKPSTPKGMQALRHILMQQMEGKIGVATLLRISQFQKFNPGKPFPCKETIYNLEIINSEITPKQLGDLLDRCPNVISLTISGCPNIKEVNFLAGRTNIMCLSLARCGSLRDGSPLKTLTQLCYLNLEECNTLRDIEFLNTLVFLRVLNLACCWMVNDFNALQNLSRIFSLNLCQCHINDPRPLTKLTSLQVLYHDRDFDPRPLQNPSLRCIKLGRR